LKDVAQEAKVAGSLINYHFESKEGLFKTCIESFAKRRMEAITRILGEARNYDEMRVRIELFVGEMLASIVEDPYGFEILDREIKAGHPMALKIFEETLLVAFKSVVAFFKQAQSRGLLKSDLEPILVATLLFSSTCDAARKDVLAKKFFNVSFADPSWRKTFVQHVVTLFMSGVMK
jgi:AcrR family transcriptional regulator